MAQIIKFLNRSAAPAWAFFVLAFLFRLAGTLLLFQNRVYFSDEAMYMRMADVVAGGQWLGEGTMIAPGPYYFWGIGKALGLDIAGLRVVHCFLGAATVSLVFLMGRRLFGARAAGMAGVVLCVYPYLIYLTGVFYAQTIVHFTLAATLYALLRFIQDGGRRWLVGGGVGLGLSGLLVVPVLTAAPILALWVLVASPGSRRRRFGSVVILAMVSLVTILPWTARNALVSGRFILVSSMGPKAFYWANNVAADPGARDPQAWLDIYQERLNREQARQGMSEAELERHLVHRSQRYLRNHPGRALRNYLTRLGMFFDVAPRSFTTNEHTGNSRTTIVAILSSVPILLLAPLGLIVARRRFRLWFPLALVPLMQALSYAAFHVSVRYRFPYEPYMILFAMVGLLGILGCDWSNDPARGASSDSTAPVA